MMADNIEHVISYWVVFQKFHSPALAGFAVLSHWLPFLLFSVAVGGLADRIDPRRIIQCGMLLFILASAGWGVFFITDTLQMWHAMLLLVIHGCAGVLWQTPNQLLLYDIVGPADLPSAVRLNAMARYLGILVGPAVGGVIMLSLGPSNGIILNTLFYLPMLLWLFWAPVSAKGAGAKAPRRARPRRHRADHPRHRQQPVLTSMTLLAGPDLVHDRQRLSRADAGLCHRSRPRRPRRGLQRAAGGRRRRRAARGHRAGSVGPASGDAGTAIVLAMLWTAVAARRSPRSRIYPLAIALLFAAGFFELSFNTMAQTLVQLNAPAEIRGRVVGLFNMAGARHAGVQRHHGRRAWRCDRHSLVARRVGRGAAGVSVAAARARGQNSRALNAKPGTRTFTTGSWNGGRVRSTRYSWRYPASASDPITY